MGNYVNIGNEAFQNILNGIYVDKTGLIDYINSTVNTPQNLTCFTRPRRFGKSFAATMLAAYYDCSCDSNKQFEHLQIGQTSSYRMYLNKYDVIYLDMISFVSRLHGQNVSLVQVMQASVIEELKEQFPGCISEDEQYLPDAMLSVHQKTGRRFVVIIDEWDALFRESTENDSLQMEYIQLLRGLFKSGPAAKTMIAAAYMTGILPIKKYGTQSAMTDFNEFTMTDPGRLAAYIGFTDDEVKNLCDQYQLDYSTVKNWYDGYRYDKNMHIYSPNSVMNAIRNGKCKNYWTNSETYESLKRYIGMNYDGLKDAVIAMLGGQACQIDTVSFQNDIVSLHSRDDVMTLLVHLGYLAYDEECAEVRIPNLEVADIFRAAIKNDNWNAVSRALETSERLLQETLAGNEDYVANALDELHSSTSSVLQYHDENSLSCALTIAYYTAKKDYEIVRELPSGKGFADLVFIPYANVSKPAVIVELKYQQDADTAIRQIKERKYAGALQQYFGEILLVGISYNKKDANKRHSCWIERLSLEDR